MAYALGAKSRVELKGLHPDMIAPASERLRRFERVRRYRRRRHGRRRHRGGTHRHCLFLNWFVEVVSIGETNAARAEAACRAC